MELQLKGAIDIPDMKTESWKYFSQILWANQAIAKETA